MPVQRSHRTAASPSTWKQLTRTLKPAPFHLAVWRDFPEAVSSSRPRWDSSFYSGREVERSEEHTSELQSHSDLVCRLLLEKKKKRKTHSGRAKQKYRAT